jgi:DNA-directed RNA polymerase II subunit RPB1
MIRAATFNHSVQTSTPLTNVEILAAPKVAKLEQENTLCSTRHLLDTLPQGNIEGIRLSLMSFEDQMKKAVCICKDPESEGMGSPNDERMGSDGKRCQTCRQIGLTCQGHEGIIVLNVPYLHPKLANPAIRAIQCVCNSCGTLLLDEETLRIMGILELSGLNRLNALADLSVKVTRCTRNPVDENGVVRYCIPNPKYNIPKDTYIVTCEYVNPMDKTQKIINEKSIREILNILSRIDPKSCTLMGFDGKTHPKDMILQALMVSPPCSRPPAIRDGISSQDHITTAYITIIRYNNMVAEAQKEGDEAKTRKNVRDLHWYISHLFDNRDNQYTRGQDEPIQSVVQRIVGKEGLFRNAIMGKRCDFTGRSVLNPCNDIEFGSISFPEAMRAKHTIPIKVVDYNLEICREMYHNDLVTHIIKDSGLSKGSIFEINKNSKARYFPEIGDTIERIGMDGDEIVFNRQPTLDKWSILGYKLKYTDRLVIGLHSSYTSPHKADFDGDEGNGQKVQTLAARAEVKSIMNVTSCVMDAKSSRPIMGLVYNPTTSSYMLTQPGVMIEKRYWEEATSFISDRDELASLSERLAGWNIKEYSGQALFSSFLPFNFYYDGKDVNGNVIKIRDGVLISGVIGNKQLGPVSCSIIHYLYKMCSEDRVARFFTEAQRVLDWYIEHVGFSVGFSSCIAENEQSVNDIINFEISQAQLEIQALGDLKSNMTDLEKEIHEKKTMGYLNRVSRIGIRISVETMTTNNPLNIMFKAGSKGKETNMAQLVGCQGQQYISGVRPRRGLTLGTRCLPYFEPYSNDIEANGFIKESFMNGSKPAGFYFHMMPSRTGVMDTALKTAEIGHYHHRMVKVMEDLVVAYDGSVRNASGNVFNYIYGGDGFSASALIPTSSQALGSVLSFIDLKSTVGRLNCEAGFD